MLLVPGTLREAADALGVEHWRAVLGVILPTAMGGIATGAILSIARAAGETAPLLFVDSIYNPTVTQLNLFGHGVPSIPIYIFTNYDLPTQSALTSVWGAALVLLTFILLANIGARAAPRPHPCEDDGMTGWDPTTSGSPTGSTVAWPGPDPGRAAGPGRAASGAEWPLARDRTRGRVRHPRDGGLLRRESGARLDDAEDLPQPGHCRDRPLGMRQDDVHPQPEPNERFDSGLQAQRAGPVSRPRCLRPRDKPRRGAATDRDGVPEAQPVPEVDLRQHRLGAAQPRDEGRPRCARRARSQRRLPCGTRSRTGCDDGALGLSGGQQQRLCIARAIAIEPDVLLLDEPASALDPIATASIEDLMHTLKHRYTIVIVTHNMQQAARVADRTAFFSLDTHGRGASWDAGRIRRHADDLQASRRHADPGLRHWPVRVGSTYGPPIASLGDLLKDRLTALPAVAGATRMGRPAGNACPGGGSLLEPQDPLDLVQLRVGVLELRGARDEDIHPNPVADRHLVHQAAKVELELGDPRIELIAPAPEVDALIAARPAAWPMSAAAPPLDLTALLAPWSRPGARRVYGGGICRGQPPASSRLLTEEVAGELAVLAAGAAGARLTRRHGWVLGRRGAQNLGR